MCEGKVYMYSPFLENSIFSLKEVNLIRTSPWSWLDINPFVISCPHNWSLLFPNELKLNLTKLIGVRRSMHCIYSHKQLEWTSWCKCAPAGFSRLVWRGLLQGSNQCADVGSVWGREQYQHIYRLWKFIFIFFFSNSPAYRLVCSCRFSLHPLK